MSGKVAKQRLAGKCLFNNLQNATVIGRKSDIAGLLTARFSIWVYSKEKSRHPPEWVQE